MHVVPCRQRAVEAAEAAAAQAHQDSLTAVQAAHAVQLADLQAEINQARSREQRYLREERQVGPHCCYSSLQLAGATTICHPSNNLLNINSSSDMLLGKDSSCSDAACCIACYSCKSNGCLCQSTVANFLIAGHSIRSGIHQQGQQAAATRI